MTNLTQHPTEQFRSRADGPEWDVVVVGGGTAGLSAALTLARARRSVLVVDAGHPRNAPAAAVHGYLTRDGVAPAEFLSLGRAEIVRYGGEVVQGTVSALERLPAGGFRVRGSGGSWEARRVLVATGLKDELPQVPGLAQRWGRDVVHCPYCHGWEVRDQPLAVLATGPLALHAAQLWRQWSKDVTLLLNDALQPSDVEREQLAARDIAVVAGAVARLDVVGDRLTGVGLVDGRVVPCRAVVLGAPLTAQADLLTGLGLELTEQAMAGHMYGTSVDADATGATAVPGVWVAGNVTSLTDSVVQAAAGAVRAAAALNADLIAEEVRQAVLDHRVEPNPEPTPEHRPPEHQSPEEQSAEQLWEGIYRERDSLWSGRPNELFVREASPLEAGNALELGCGEGADAIWLAERGWSVTAVDVSRTALERAAGHAVEAGVDDRIRWEQRDLYTSFPAGTYDLVTAQYLHSTVERAGAREAVLRRAADCVAPGGLLLVIGHAGFATWQQPPLPDVKLPSTYELLAALELDPDQWQQARHDSVDRRATGPDGQPGTRRDNVLAIRRR